MPTAKSLSTVCMIGAGGVATHLATALHKAGFEIRSVYSRTMASATKLADSIQARPTDNLSQIGLSDIYVISVTDTALPALLPTLQTTIGEQTVLHTAGSIPLSLLSQYFRHCGVLYPLQTFSRSRPVQFRHIPLLIEANNEHAMGMLRQLADRLSDRVVPMDSARRKMVHLAAVFASNFANHCYALASEILEGVGGDYSLLQPLIEETAGKAARMHPITAQTGPAIRGDQAVMSRHLDLLEGSPQLQAIYRLMSEDIRRSGSNSPDKTEHKQTETQ